MRRLVALGLAAGLGLAGSLAAGRAGAGTDLIVSAAISLRDVLRELKGPFEASHPGVVVRLNLGASGELQKQIEAGAPVDVFLSAAPRQMDELARRGLIQAETRVVFATNALVVVVPAGASWDLASPADLARPDAERLVIGNPKTVPAGQYAEESLRTLGLWEDVRARAVLAENVRQALEYVARGEVDAGIVYRSDAATRPGRVRVAFALPEDSHGPIRYPAAVLRDARRPALGAAFLRLLVSARGQAALAEHGFEPVRDAR